MQWLSYSWYVKTKIAILKNVIRPSFYTVIILFFLSSLFICVHLSEIFWGGLRCEIFWKMPSCMVNGGYLLYFFPSFLYFPPVSTHPLWLPYFPDKKENGSIPPAVVMPTPSKRGRKKKSMLPRDGPVTAHTLPTGSDALILAHLAAGGQVSFTVEAL